MKFPRASGILLHPTSLPGEFGIGDLGPQAYNFVDFLVEARQSYWQILPLGPTGYGDSPYQCFSAFAGNTLLISPEKLVELGLLSAERIADKPAFEPGRVDYGGVYEWKNLLLPEAFENFQATTSVDLRGKFETFVQSNDWWLEEYAAYKAIKTSESNYAWYNWAAPLKRRMPETMQNQLEALYDQIQAEKFYQFLFYSQWLELKSYANRQGVKIIGDVPIFVALDSADVWAEQDNFKLNDDCTAKVVAGVPPDYFSKTGQLWGNPIYDWDKMKSEGFPWWIARMKFALKMQDIVRVDHFRGFAAAWEVPALDNTAEHGRWVNVPGHELFSALRNAIAELPVIAEDLGVITPDVEELRDGFGFPGMRILQFAFGGDAHNHDLPHNYIKNCVAYSGTHDNDTTLGWWNSQVGDSSTRDESAISREHNYCLEYLGTDGDQIHWDFVRTVWASVADTAIAPLQDLLGLGNEARMNLPASSSGNWYWRYNYDDITEEIAQKLKNLTEIYGRCE